MALLPQDPKQQKQLLLGVVPLLLAFAYYQFYHTGRATAAEELLVRVETIEASNSTARAIAAQYGPQLGRQIELYQEHLRRLEDLIPRREDVPELLNLITQQPSVEMASIEPQPEQAGTFYIAQSYALAVLGEYHEIGEYLTYIGSLPRIIKPSRVRLQIQTERAGAAPLLRAEFLIQTYVIPHTPMTAPDTAGGNNG